jgi:hypothetical protein
MLDFTLALLHIAAGDAVIDIRDLIAIQGVTAIMI